ncbi:MAG: STAS/SEC14 domain-containing protein [bacterium]|nr:STAS/SEC14 domain-containing protein [bacterium]
MYQFSDQSSENLVGIEVSGKLTHDDYKSLVPEMEKKIAASGALRALFDMENFSGVQPRAAWDDFKFWLKHSMDVERVAIVGNKHWEEWATKMGAHFIKAEVRYFDASEKETAWQWLREG